MLIKNRNRSTLFLLITR